MWKTISASVAGSAHSRRAVECQDKSEVLVYDVQGSCHLVAAVADGAGSALHGALGAQIVVTEMVRTLIQCADAVTPPSEVDARQWISNLQGILDERAAEISEEIGALACTLLACLIGPMHSVFIHIGDGGWIAKVDNELQAVTYPYSGEYENETVFITTPTCVDKLQFVCIERPVEMVAAYTDGLQHLCLDYRSRRPHEGFFGPIMLRLSETKNVDALNESLVAFLNSDAINERTDDDKTLFMAVRDEAYQNTCF
ncbi:MAG: protein phosphatase 2C domain-containing protein [Candidatus Hydrogenedentes bacterium]|nr:protein phosphatase 2C domain-containing protein [Candidatus Hydrogenedentota bacterium]